MGLPAQPIRILHVVGTMNRGGTEALIMEFYRHIDTQKIQFDFFVYNYSDEAGAYDDEIRALGGKIYNAKSRFYRNPLAFCGELKQFFKAHPEYRIVHSHQYATSGFILVMAKKTLKSCVTVAHSHIAFPHVDPLRKAVNRIGKRLLKRYADFGMGCSEDALLELFGHSADNQKYFVVKNAINPAKFLYNEQIRAEYRTMLGIDDNNFVVGNVARFNYQKNHTFLIDIFNDIHSEKGNCCLVLVGTGEDEQLIQEKVKNLGLEDSVMFLGSRADVDKLVNVFDLFLFPSRYEGLGIVLIEAQANGLPCVMSADVIPDEADVGVGLVTRIDLQESSNAWAQKCLFNIGKRIDAQTAQQAVISAGYDMKSSAKWLEKFYLEHWENISD